MSPIFGGGLDPRRGMETDAENFRGSPFKLLKTKYTPARAPISAMPDETSARAPVAVGGEGLVAEVSGFICHLGSEA